MVVSEDSAKNFIIDAPTKYIDSFTTFIPKGYAGTAWETFTPDEKSQYIQWYFNKDNDLGSDSYFNSGNPTMIALSDRLTEGHIVDIFLNRFPDQIAQTDEHDNPDKITAYNVWNRMNILLNNKGGYSRRTKRQRPRKYKKSRRLVKNRRTRRR